MNHSINIVLADITTLNVDVIVNAANNTLLGGGGVDGSIHRAAGPDLLEECKSLNGCNTGQAKLTSAFKLPSKWIIHTVGPVWQGGHFNEAELLASCYSNCLKLAFEKGCQSIAFPAISTGVYGYPKSSAAKIALSIMVGFAKKNPAMSIYAVCFTKSDVKLYNEVLNSLC